MSFGFSCKSIIMCGSLFTINEREDPAGLCHTLSNTYYLLSLDNKGLMITNIVIHNTSSKKVHGRVLTVTFVLFQSFFFCITAKKNKKQRRNFNIAAHWSVAIIRIEEYYANEWWSDHPNATWSEQHKLLEQCVLQLDSYQIYNKPKVTRMGVGVLVYWEMHPKT